MIHGQNLSSASGEPKFVAKYFFEILQPLVSLGFNSDRKTTLYTWKKVVHQLEILLTLFLDNNAAAQRAGWKTS
jgi:hypothetical protein